MFPHTANSPNSRQGAFPHTDNSPRSPLHPLLSPYSRPKVPSWDR